MEYEGGKFSSIAESLSKRLHGRTKEGLGITVGDILEVCVDAEVLGSRGINMVNCYPGDFRTNICCPVAFFISINGVAAQGQGHFSFSKIMEKFHRHMYTQCFMRTREAAIISNDWVTKEYEKYEDYIRRLRGAGVRIEAYFIGGRMENSLLVDI